MKLDLDDLKPRLIDALAIRSDTLSFEAEALLAFAKEARAALEIYAHKGNWRYWSNYDVGAFKEEWIWRKNGPGNNTAREVLTRWFGNE